MRYPASNRNLNAVQLTSRNHYGSKQLGSSTS
jgi:hypothetical protein